MPESFSHFDAQIADHVRQSFPDRERTRVLDVGAGRGKYRELFPDFPMEAIEICERYVERFDLRGRYDVVHRQDVRTLPRAAFQSFGLVLLGDVLEHLSVSDAQTLLAKLEGIPTLVTVPYGYAQDGSADNPHEEHVQADLTHALFEERYPGFTCLVRNHLSGVYLRDWPGSSSAHEERMVFDASEFKARHVLIATPTADGSVCTQYVRSLFETQHVFASLGLRLGLMFMTGASVERARNQIVRDFMRGPFTDLLFVDSDQGWEADHVLRLLWQRKPVVGAASRLKSEVAQYALRWIDGDWILQEGDVLEVESVGSGFLMIARHVFVELFKAHPELQIGKDPDYYQLFQFTLDDEGRYWSEDLAFCHRWRALGGHIYVDPYPRLIHVGSREYAGSLIDTMREA